jgi:hypothetical protein
MTPVCDFCNVTPVLWTYPARDFQHRAPDFTFNSSGGWAACARCHELIERGDRQGLADRSARGHPERGRIPLNALRSRLRALHDSFWANREGEPVPDDGTDTDPTRPGNHNAT